MSAPVGVVVAVVAVLLVAFAVLIAVTVVRRRRAARSQGPRTVAELVRMRAERAAAEEPAPVSPAADDADAADDRDSAVRDADAAAEPADEPATATAPPREPGTEPAFHDLAPGGRHRAGPARPPTAAPPPAPGGPRVPDATDPPGSPESPDSSDSPDSPDSPDEIDLPAARIPVEPSPSPRAPVSESAPRTDVAELTGDDTPWRRAALMVSAAGAPTAYVPRLAPPTVAAPRVAERGEWSDPDGAIDDGWSGWADWSHVDAEVEAETEGRAERAPIARAPRAGGSGRAAGVVRLLTGNGRTPVAEAAENPQRRLTAVPPIGGRRPGPAASTAGSTPEPGSEPASESTSDGAVPPAPAVEERPERSTATPEPQQEALPAPAVEVPVVAPPTAEVPAEVDEATAPAAPAPAAADEPPAVAEDVPAAVEEPPVEEAPEPVVEASEPVVEELAEQVPGARESAPPEEAAVAAAAPASIPDEPRPGLPTAPGRRAPSGWDAVVPPAAGSPVAALRPPAPPEVGMTPVEPARITRPPVLPPPRLPVVDADPTLTAAPLRRRPLRSPAEQAAEQAAADLALLRTFGYADPSLRPDSSPVVSLASPHGPEPEPATAGAAQPVSFRVLGHDGAAVGRAAVTLLDDRGRRTASGAAGVDGAGSVEAPRPGAYMLVASAPGHQSVAVALTVADGPARADVLLTRSASVSGGVFGEDGPIAGARVTLVQDGEIVDAVDSAADGGFRLEDVPAGEYGLSVAAAGCEPFAALLVVPEETAVRRDVELESALAQTDHDDPGSEFPDVADLLRGGVPDPPRR